MFGSEEWLRAYRSAPLAIEDAHSDPLSRDFRQGYEALGVRSYATSPFIREGRWVAVLAVTDDQPRAWTQRELDLMENAVARVWPLVERARVAGEFRSSEERFRMFADHMGALAGPRTGSAGPPGSTAAGSTTPAPLWMR